MDDTKSLQDALTMARRALAVLEEQTAGFGSLEIPVSLKLQLEDKRAEVAALELRLGAAPAACAVPSATQGGTSIGTQINIQGDLHATIASGERSVAIGGNAIGNTFNIGDILAGLAAAQSPADVKDSERTLLADQIPHIALCETSGNIYRPRKLLGRDALLQVLDDKFKTSKHILLYGMAGIGKTALAATVADRHIKRGKGPVLWLQMVNADAGAIFKLIIERFATNEENAKFSSLAGDERRATIRKLLRRSKITMVVLDDAWNGQSLSEVVKAIPKELFVLVTSRAKFPLEEPEALIETGVLSPEAALDLLNYHAGHQYNTDQGASALCQVLGYHPYALEIAGATLKAGDLTPDELYQEVALAPHEQAMPLEFAAKGRESIKCLLDCSFDALPAEMQQVFTAFGAFFTSGLTSDLLTIYLGDSIIKNLNKVLRDLAQRSLIKRGAGNYYYLHDLTFRYIQAVFDNSQAGYEPTIRAVQCFVNKNARNFDLLALEQGNILQSAKLSQAKSNDILIDIITTLTTGGYLDAYGHSTQLVELLDTVIQRVESQGPEQRDLLHYLLSKRGNVYVLLGDMENAFQAYDSALTLAPNPKRQAILWGVIGKVRIEQKLYSEAEVCFQQGCKLAIAQHDDLTLAFVLEQQSFGAARRGDFETAHQIAAEAVRIVRAATPTNSIRLGYLLLNLGSTELDSGNASQAIITHTEAYQIAAAENHLQLKAFVMYALGQDYHALGNHDEVRNYLSEARKVFHELGSVPWEIEVKQFMDKAGYTE